MKKLTLIGFLAFFVNLTFAQECTHLWYHTTEINPVGPKPLSGDTYVVYGLIGWHDEPNLRLQFKGDFPRARFMSYESYKTPKKNHVHALFDYEILPDEGSENPFMEGILMETQNRAYTIDAMVEADVEVAFKNTLKLAPNEKIHSIFYRAYVPFDGVVPTPADLPKIFAYNTETGAPAPCPKALDTIFKPGIETVLLHFIAEKKKFTFKETPFDIGSNKAIPKYVYGVSKTKHGKATMIRFKTPTFFNSQSGAGPFKHEGEVRYWSLCTQNLKVSQTLNCLPDYMAKPDAKGFVTVVVGGGEEVKKAAEARGYSYLDDKRASDQKVAAYFYRNVLPKADFPMYEGDYMPIAVVCTAKEFLSEKCKF